MKVNELNKNNGICFRENQNKKKIFNKADVLMTVIPAPIFALASDIYYKSKADSNTELINKLRNEQKGDDVHQIRSEIRQTIGAQENGKKTTKINAVLNNNGTVGQKGFSYYICKWFQVDNRFAYKRVKVPQEGLKPILEDVLSEYENSDVHTVIQADGLKEYIKNNQNDKEKISEVGDLIKNSSKKYHTTLVFDSDDGIKDFVTGLNMGKNELFVLDGSIEKQFYANEKRDIWIHVLAKRNDDLSDKKHRVSWALAAMAIGLGMVIVKKYLANKNAKKQENKVEQKNAKPDNAK